MIKALKNPFYIYIISFLLVFAIYGLGWSDLYPNLSFSIIFFFVITFIIFFFLGYMFDKLRVLHYMKLSMEKIGSKPLNFLLFLWGGYIIEFIYFGEIPLLNLIKGIEGVNYKEFGIKSLHVLLISFNSFLIVYLFHCYISTKKSRILVYYLLSILPAILVVNRGMFLIGMLSSLFVFLMSRKRFLTIKQLLFTTTVLLVILYFFGVLGNLRSAAGDPLYIPKESMASDTFMESSIPKEYYWTYLYGASPLANFQYNVNSTKEVDFNLFDLVLFELTPDVISKRIAYTFDRQPPDPYKIREWLTVGTVYSRAYSFAKWLGPILIFIYTTFVIIITIGLVPKRNSYHVSTVAILSTLIFMNTFSNMFIFSGLILQLGYCILFSFIGNKKFVFKTG